MTRKRKRLKKLAQSIGIQRNDFESWHYRMSIGAYDLYADPLDYDETIKYIKDYKPQGYMVRTVTKRAEKALFQIGINARYADKSFKNFLKVLDEISEKWDELQNIDSQDIKRNITKNEEEN